MLQKFWRKKSCHQLGKKPLLFLFNKKGSTDNPGNYHPNTLEKVTLKILTSMFHNKVCQHLPSDNYIETNIQKGFFDGICTTLCNLLSCLIGALEVYGETITSLIRFLSDSDMNKKEIDFALCKISNVCIWCTYYIFSCRNKEWCNPELCHF